MTVEEKFSKLLGRELTTDEQLEFTKLARVLDIGDNDALWSVVVLLYLYQSKYAQIPAKIETAANAAANSAATKSQEQINDAVAALAPTIQKTVERSAQAAMGRLQIIPTSIASIAAVVVLGLYGGGCYQIGRRGGDLYYFKAISSDVWWEQMKLANVFAFIIPAFLFSGYLLINSENYDAPKWGYGLVIIAIICTLCLPLKVYGIIH